MTKDAKINALISLDHSWFARFPTEPYKLAAYIQKGMRLLQAHKQMTGTQQFKRPSPLLPSRPMLWHRPMARHWRSALMMYSGPRGRWVSTFVALMSTCPCYHMATSKRMQSRVGQAATLSLVATFWHRGFLTRLYSKHTWVHLPL